jgi:hypothetical protein
MERVDIGLASPQAVRDATLSLHAATDFEGTMSHGIVPPSRRCVTGAVTDTVA